MDRQPDLTPDDTAGAPAPVDQAVFTSVRSPMGEGYRLTAASAGLSVDEKREITQRAPSHGSLCDPSPAAAGLASYPLSSGRHCVAVSRYGGTEHTARGGQRVYTHIVVLRRADFRRFRCNPLTVHAALRRAAGDDVLLQAGVRLEQLALRVAATRPARPPAQADDAGRTCDPERIADIVQGVLEGRRLVVNGAPAPRDVLALTLQALPLVVRQSLATAYGIKLTPSRIFPLTFIHSGRTATARMLDGRGVVLYDWESPPARRRSPFVAWTDFVRTRWGQGRHGDVEHVAARVTANASAEYLRRIAALCAEIERAQEADPEMLAELSARCAGATASGNADAELLDELRRAVQARREELPDQCEHPCG